eukprot:COSAG01_NODE_51460_length_354_cov_2.403922_1_plen_40_part_10
MHFRGLAPNYAMLKSKAMIVCPRGLLLLLLLLVAGGTWHH